MFYIFNNKRLNIPDSFLANSMKNLNLSKMEAVQMWLEDNGYLKNQEQEELSKKAAVNKIDHGTGTAKKGTSIPRQKKENPDKQCLISALLSALDDERFTNVKVVNPEREICLNFNNNSYSVVLTCHRNK